MKLTQSLPALLAVLSLTAASAQQPVPKPSATPFQFAPPPIIPPTGTSPMPAVAPTSLEPPLPVADVPLTPVKEPKPPVKGGILLNFQGASLTDVLNYLSEAAGFVIVQESPVTGTVNVVSRQPISPEDAVDLLNTVLAEKGYIAIRNGRILKIVSRANAQKRDLPVQMGSDPEQIPRKDEMVTQILPLRFGEAAKLVENLRPLLSDTATISSNDGSNAILLTDTQTNIRRIAQIIRAIDTSVASISTIHVYPLQYADSKGLATVITQLFANDTAPGAAQQQGGRGGRRGGFGGFGFGGPGGGAGGAPGQAAPPSEARQAASRVIAVADEQSNSLIVSAPDEVLPTITDIVNKIDTNITDLTDTRIFHLLHADALETADLFNSLYGTTSGTPQNGQNGRNNNNNRNGRQGGGGFGVPGQQAATGTAGAPSERAVLQAQFMAVGDARTNSLLVSASRDTMAGVAEMIGRLDASDAKKQHVYIHSLEHTDADSVANVLRGMLGDQTAITNASNAASRLNQRTTTGATIDTTTSSSSGRSTR